MIAREFNPRRLDVEAFAKAGGQESGEWPVGDLERLAGGVFAKASGPAPAVRWSVRGEYRRPSGAEAEIWLHLKAGSFLQLECQRCLSPVETALDVERSFRFVAGERQAAALDAEIEDDVLALSKKLDLLELIEDELLLALPLVPRHEDCPQPLRFGHEPDREPDTRPNPFSALQTLKKPGAGH
jgi:uncharacterized protein